MKTIIPFSGPPVALGRADAGTHAPLPRSAQLLHLWVRALPHPCHQDACQPNFPKCNDPGRQIKPYSRLQGVPKFRLKIMLTEQA